MLQNIPTPQSAGRAGKCVTDLEQRGASIFGSTLPKNSGTRRGRVSGGFARGSELHAWAIEDGRIPLWNVRVLNVNEKRVAKELIRHGTSSGLVLADAGGSESNRSSTTRAYTSEEQHG